MIAVNPQDQVLESFWSWCRHSQLPLEFVALDGAEMGDEPKEGYIYQEERDQRTIRLGFSQPITISWVGFLTEVLLHLMADQENQFVMASVVHEVKNPLTVAIGYQELLSQAYSHPLLNKTIELLMQLSDRLEDVLHGYQNALHFEDFDVTRLCREVADEFQEDLACKGIHLMIRGAPLWSRGDRKAIRQVIRNLLGNARDAVDGGGEIKIAIQDEDSYVILRISDNGAGIADALRPFLFHPYYTSKDDGHGLGLVICRRIVQQHHGEITIEDQRPGTVVVVTLPKNPQSKAIDLG